MKKLFCLLIVSIIVQVSKAQWLNSPFPSSGITQIEDVLIFNETNLMVCGWSGPVERSVPSILKSNDQGTTFRDITPSILQGTTGSVSQLKKVGNRIYFTASVEEDLIWGYSDDLGNSWETQRFEYFSWTQLPIDFYSQNLGLISNGFGTLLRTTNGGNTWSEIAIATNDIRAIQFASAEVVYILTGHMEIFVSHDAGLSWSKQGQVYVNLGIKTVLHVVDETTLYIATERSFHRSRDEGRSFLSQNFTQNHVMDMHFINGTLGFIVGFSVNNSTGAMIGVTEDGGITWKIEHSSTPIISNYRAIDEYNGQIFAGGFGITSRVSNLNGRANVTAFMSGFNEYCPGEESQLRMSFTGKSPWEVTYRLEDRSNKEIIVTAPDTSFTTTATGNYFPFILNAIDGDNVNAYKASMANFRPNDALKAQVIFESDTICSGESISIPIALDGCGPWSLEFSDGTDTKTIDNITESPLMLDLTPEKSTNYQLVSLKDQRTEIRFDDRSQQFDLYVDDINQTTITESIDQCYLDEPFAIVSYEGYSFPWSYTYLYLDTAVTVNDIFVRQDTIKLTQSGNYELIINSLTNQCGTITSDLTSTINVERLIAPEITQSERYRYESLVLSFAYDFDETDTVFIQKSINMQQWETVDSVIDRNTYTDLTIEPDQDLRYRLMVRTLNDCQTISEVEAIRIPAFFEEIQIDDDIDFGGVVKKTAIYDINRDGLEDILADRVYFNNGNGSFTKSDIEVQDEFLITDYNKNKKPDLVLRNEVLLDFDNNGYANREETSRLPFEAHQADIDFDGDIDIISDGKLYINELDLMDFEEMKVIEFEDDPNFEYYYPLDYNEDGQVDLVNLFFLYKNTGALTFDKIRFDQADRPGRFFAWADFNNDGQLDSLPIQDAVAGDFNNDGWLDILKGRSILFNNQQGGFSESILVEDQESIYRSVSDLDGDGRLDVLAMRREEVKWYQNNLTENNWMQVKLTSTHSNFLALHAKIYLWAKIGGRQITQMRQVQTISNQQNSGHLHHFGLGDAIAIDSIRIEWPSGLISSISNVAINQTLAVAEPEANIPPEEQITFSAKVYSAEAINVEILENSSIALGTVVEYSLDSLNFIPIDTLQTGSKIKLISGLNPSTKYYFRAYQYNLAGTSAYSNVASATTFNICKRETKIAIPEMNFDVYRHELSVPDVTDYQYRWQLNESDLQNGDQHTFTASRAGVYRVIIRDQFNCVDTSNHVVIRELMPLNYISVNHLDSSLVLKNVVAVNMDHDPETELLVHVTNGAISGPTQGLVFDQTAEGNFDLSLTMPSSSQVGWYFSSYPMDYNHDNLPDINLRTSQLLINEFDTLLPAIADPEEFHEVNFRAIHAVDFNNDGLTDIYMDKAQVGFRGPSKDELYLRQNDGSYSMSMVDVFNGVSALVDLDNDGTTEVWAHYKFYKFQDGQLVEFADGPDWHSHSKYYPIWADFNNDLQMDLFVNGRMYYMNGKDLLEKENFVNGISIWQPTIIADLDNNGWKDILLSNSFDQFQLIMQMEKGSYVSSYNVGLLSDFRKKDEVADLDLDGDLDLISFLENDSLLTQFGYYENKASEFYHGTTIQLNASVSNPFGVGATVYVTTQRNGETFVQMDQMLGKDNFSLHFGLADAEVIDKIEVRWPSGAVSDTFNIPANTPYIKLTEPDPSDSFCDIGEVSFAFDSIAFFCEGKSRLVADGALFHHRFDWYKDGEIIENSSGQILEITTSGNYQLSVSSEFCNADVDPQDIEFQPLQSEDIVTHTELSVCEPDTVYFNVSPLDYPNLTYQWKKDGELYANDATELKAYESGIYELTVIYNGETTCDFLSYSYHVTIREAFEVRLTANEFSLSASIFRNDNRINGGFFIYRWFRDGKQVYSTVNDSFYQPDSSGVYTVEADYLSIRCAYLSEPVDFVHVNDLCELTSEKYIEVEGGDEDFVYTISSDGTCTYKLGFDLDYRLFEISNGRWLSFRKTPDYENPQDEDKDNIYHLDLVMSNNLGGQKTERLIIEVKENLVTNTAVVDDLLIYPNPVTDKFFLKNSLNQKIAFIEVMNLVGEKVGQIKGNKQNAYQLPNLASGIYFLSVINTDNQMIYRVRIVK